MELDFKKEFYYVASLEDEEERQIAQQVLNEKILILIKENPELAEQKRLELLYCLQDEVEDLKNELSEYQADKRQRLLDFILILKKPPQNFFLVKLSPKT
jgi:hypothetical protein